MISRIRVRQVAGEEVVVEAQTGQHALIEAHLAELKPIFEQALGAKNVSLRMAERSGDQPTEESEKPTPTNLDAALEHPLVQQVAKIFEATPKRVERRHSGS